MRHLIFAITLALAALLAASAAAEPADQMAKVTILHTTDLHGSVLGDKGLARIATLIERERQSDPRLLLVDCGDTIQGSSMAWLTSGQHIIDCMNHLRYDAMTVGNHEFNYGPQVFRDRRAQARFPWLSANIVGSGDAARTAGLPIRPYIIRNAGGVGVRVGIIGLTVTDIPSWEQPDYISGIRFTDIVQEAKRWTRIVRPLCDLLVVVAHTGVKPNGAYKGFDPGAAGSSIAAACPEIDVLICGHRHVAVASERVNGVLLTEAGSEGSHLGKVQVTLSAARDGGRRRVLDKKAELLKVSPAIPASDAVLDLMKPYEQRWQAWAEEKVGTLASDLDFRGSQRRETTGTNFIHQALSWATGADVTFHVAFNDSTSLAAGAVTNEDIYGVYGYDNALWVLTLTGRQIKEALEAGASDYGTWGFLTAAGIRYKLDPSRPKGERLISVSYDGKPLPDSLELRVAVNHYNAMGGGGMKALRQASKVEKTGKSIRDVLAAYLSAHSPYTPSIAGWWNAAAPALTSPAPAH